MRIFNSFDTKLKTKELNKAIFIFWENKVIMVSRSLAFWIFKWVLPFILWLLFSSMSFLLYDYVKELYKPIAILILIIWWLFTLYLLIKTFNTYLSYKFDFCLVTPEELFTHKQKWIFLSNYKNIPVEKIRSIQSRHDSFIWNVFNYWIITILTDWWVAAQDEDIENIESSWAWIIKLTFVSWPNITKKKILLLCIHKWCLQDIEDNKYKI